MARGYLYFVSGDKEEECRLDPDEVTVDIGGSEIEWSSPLESQDEAVERLGETLKQHGASASIEKDGEGRTMATLVPTEDFKRSWFKERLSGLKKAVEALDLDGFALGDLKAWEIRKICEDDFGDMVYSLDYSYETFDQFVRRARTGVPFYFKDAILLH